MVTIPTGYARPNQTTRATCPLIPPQPINIEWFLSETKNSES